MKGPPGSEGEGEPEDPVIVNTFPATMYTNAYTFEWQSVPIFRIGPDWCIDRRSRSPQQLPGLHHGASAAPVDGETVDRRRVPGKVEIGAAVLAAFG